VEPALRRLIVRHTVDLGGKDTLSNRSRRERSRPARPTPVLTSRSLPWVCRRTTPPSSDGLRRLGYAQGRNLRYRLSLWPCRKARAAGAGIDRAASAPSAAIAFKGVAPTLPIVCLGLTDAGIPHLFASYARPGGNLTGMAQSVEGVTGKLVDVALEVVPGARQIGFLSNPEGASMRLFVQSVEVAARGRGMPVLTEEATTGGELRRNECASFAPVLFLFALHRRSVRVFHLNVD